MSKVVEMKLSLVLSFGLLSSLAYCQSASIYACMKMVAQKNDINLAQQIDFFEEDLYENGYLQSMDGIGILKIFRGIAATNKIDMVTNLDLGFQKIPSQEFANCFWNLKSQNLKISKLHQRFSSIGLEEDSLLSKLASTYIEVLDSSDFYSEPFRTYFFWVLYLTSQPSPGLSFAIEPLQAGEYNDDEVFVEIDDKDSVYLAGKQVSLDSLAVGIKDYVISKEKPEVIFMVAASTSYTVYEAVQEEIIKGWAMARNDKSIEMYGAAFDKIGIDEKEKINNLIPFRVQETLKN